MLLRLTCLFVAVHLSLTSLSVSETTPSSEIRDDTDVRIDTKLSTSNDLLTILSASVTDSLPSRNSSHVTQSAPDAYSNTLSNTPPQHVESTTSELPDAVRSQTTLSYVADEKSITHTYLSSSESKSASAKADSFSAEPRSSESHGDESVTKAVTTSIYTAAHSPSGSALLVALHPSEVRTSQTAMPSSTQRSDDKSPSTVTDYPTTDKDALTSQTSEYLASRVTLDTSRHVTDAERTSAVLDYLSSTSSAGFTDHTQTNRGSVQTDNVTTISTSDATTSAQSSEKIERTVMYTAEIQSYAVTLSTVEPTPSAYTRSVESTDAGDRTTLHYTEKVSVVDEVKLSSLSTTESVSESNAAASVTSAGKSSGTVASLMSTKMASSTTDVSTTLQNTREGSIEVTSGTGESRSPLITVDSADKTPQHNTSNRPETTTQENLLSSWSSTYVTNTLSSEDSVAVFTTPVYTAAVHSPVSSSLLVTLDAAVSTGSEARTSQTAKPSSASINISDRSDDKSPSTVTDYPTTEKDALTSQTSEYLASRVTLDTSRHVTDAERTSAVLDYLSSTSSAGFTHHTQTNRGSVQRDDVTTISTSDATRFTQSTQKIEGTTNTAEIPSSAVTSLTVEATPSVSGESIESTDAGDKDTLYSTENFSTADEVILSSLSTTMSFSESNSATSVTSAGKSPGTDASFMLTANSSSTIDILAKLENNTSEGSIEVTSGTDEHYSRSPLVTVDSADKTPENNTSNRPETTTQERLFSSWLSSDVTDTLSSNDSLATSTNYTAVHSSSSSALLYTVSHTISTGSEVRSSQTAMQSSVSFDSSERSSDKSRFSVTSYYPTLEKDALPTQTSEDVASRVTPDASRHLTDAERTSSVLADLSATSPAGFISDVMMTSTHSTEKIKATITNTAEIPSSTVTSSTVEATLLVSGGSIESTDTRDKTTLHSTEDFSTADEVILSSLSTTRFFNESNSATSVTSAGKSSGTVASILSTVMACSTADVSTTLEHTSKGSIEVTSGTGEHYSRSPLVTVDSADKTSDNNTTIRPETTHVTDAERTSTLLTDLASTSPAGFTDHTQTNGAIVQTDDFTPISTSEPRRSTESTEKIEGTTTNTEEIPSSTVTSSTVEQTLSASARSVEFTDAGNRTTLYFTGNVSVDNDVNLSSLSTTKSLSLSATPATAAGQSSGELASIVSTVMASATTDFSTGVERVESTSEGSIEITSGTSEHYSRSPLVTVDSTDQTSENNTANRPEPTTQESWSSSDVSVTSKSDDFVATTPNYTAAHSPSISDLLLTVVSTSSVMQASQTTTVSSASINISDRSDDKSPSTVTDYLTTDKDALTSQTSEYLASRVTRDTSRYVTDAEMTSAVLDYLSSTSSAGFTDHTQTNRGSVQTDNVTTKSTSDATRSAQSSEKTVTSTAEIQSYAVTLSTVEPTPSASTRSVESTDAGDRTTLHYTEKVSVVDEVKLSSLSTTESVSESSPNSATSITSAGRSSGTLASFMSTTVASSTTDDSTKLNKASEGSIQVTSDSSENYSRSPLVTADSTDQTAENSSSLFADLTVSYSRSSSTVFVPLQEKLETDERRTLAIVLGTVGGLLVILILVFVVCYMTHRWPWLAANQRSRILRAEIALNGDYFTDVRPVTRRIFSRHRPLSYLPSSEPVQQPSAPEQTVIDLDELDAVRGQPTLIWKAV